VVAALVVAVLTALGAFRGSGSQPEEVPDSLEETALRLVDEFAAAWNRGDAAAADGLVADEWASVALPGLTDPWFAPEDGREGLTEGLTFLSLATDLSLGRCSSAVPPPDAVTEAVVTCPEAAFGGAYLTAVRRNAWTAETSHQTVSGMVFGIRGNRIVAIEIEDRSFSPQAYCIWAEASRPAAAAALFDLHCRPVTAAENAAGHIELAGEYLAAGAPVPTADRAEARLSALYVDRFVEHHNLGDTLTIRGWLSRGVRAADLPGFAGGTDAEVADYLSWSSRLVEIRAGACTVEAGDATTTVTCPGMTVAGPMFAEPVPQPTRFVLASANNPRAIARAYARILAVEPLADDTVPVQDACQRLQLTDLAGASFTADCEPVYTKEAADLLVAVLAARPGGRG
jgi:hypothetical protein